MSIDVRRLHKGDRHLLAWLPSAPGDCYGLSGRIVVLIGADGGKAVQFGGCARITGPGQQKSFGGKRSSKPAIVRSRGGGGRNESSLVIIHPGNEQIRCRACVSARQQHRIVVGQSDGQLMASRRSTRYHGPCRGNRIVNLGRRQITATVISADHGDAPIKKSRRTCACASSTERGRVRRSARYRIKDFAACGYSALTGCVSNDSARHQHASII